MEHCHITLSDRLIHLKSKWKRSLVRKLWITSPPKGDIPRLIKAIQPQIDQIDPIRAGNIPLEVLDQVIKEGIAIKMIGNPSDFAQHSSFWLNGEQVTVEKVDNMWGIWGMGGEVIKFPLFSPIPVSASNDQDSNSPHVLALII